MNQSLQDNMEVTASVGMVDAKGNPIAGVAFDAAPSWNISDGTVATIAPAADGMNCVVTANGAPGASAVLTVNGSVAGVAYNATATVTVTASAVAGITITFGTPVAQS